MNDGAIALPLARNATNGTTMSPPAISLGCPVNLISSTRTLSSLVAEVTRMTSLGRMFGTLPSQQSPGRGSPSGPWLTSSPKPSTASPRASPVAVPMTLPPRCTSTVSSSPSA